MNLGNRRLENVELARAFESFGCQDVGVFLASGNVAFSSKKSHDKLLHDIESGLAKGLGYSVPTILRTDEAVHRVAVATPFADRKPGTRGKMQVMWLRAVPPSTVAEQIRAFATEDDWLALDGDVLFWWPRDGVGSSQLDFRALDKLLGTTTVRTHQTVVRMGTKYFSS